MTYGIPRSSALLNNNSTRGKILHYLERPERVLKYIGVTSEEFIYIRRHMLPRYNDLTGQRSTKFGPVHSLTCELWIIIYHINNYLDLHDLEFVFYWAASSIDSSLNFVGQIYLQLVSDMLGVRWPKLAEKNADTSQPAGLS